MLPLIDFARSIKFKMKQYPTYVTNKMQLFRGIVSFLILLAPVWVSASDYAGQESRTIKSLSKQDIEDIEKGRGWGLAKPAELNGLPGPVHLLELRDALSLSDSQIEEIESLYHAMNLEAREVGARYIEQERAIEHLLTQPQVSENTLTKAVQFAAETYAELRLTHLKAHLATPAVLTDEQIAHYQVLRGYDSADPCESPPAGHDPAMWKRHNNCE